MSTPTPTDGAETPVVAVDVGGTKIAVALVASDGRILAHATRPTLATGDAERTFAPCAEAIREVLAALDPPRTAGIDVGIGSAGPIDIRAQTVSPVNIAAWRSYPLAARIRETVSAVTGGPVRVRLAGDGHAVALGEHWLGAGRGRATMVGMVVSTGIGAGAVVDDVLFAGSTGNAVHIGHTSVDAFGEVCACGNVGCVEQYARGPRMVERALGLGWRPSTAKAPTAEELCDDARAGDATATTVIDEAMRYLAAGIAATATCLDIDFFVVGGGVAKAGDVVFDPLRRHLRLFTHLPYVRGLTVVPAERNDSGLLGAASLALSLSGRGPLRAPA